MCTYKYIYNYSCEDLGLGLDLRLGRVGFGVKLSLLNPKKMPANYKIKKIIK